VAFADLFTAMALFAFALYGVQRQKLIEIEQPVQVFAKELNRALRDEGLKVDYDAARSRLALPEALLFETGKWKIRDPRVVTKISRAMLQVRTRLHGQNGSDGTRSFHLVIRGHADARPVPNESNLWLSRQRARTLEEALSRNGIAAPDFHLSSEAVGDSEPTVDNCSPQTKALRRACPGGQFASDEALAPNRRIELRFGFFTGS
jgi:outer membrane protein OmpA-like peptidoglycan-associated protein